MHSPSHLSNVLIGAVAVLVSGARLVPGSNASGPVLTAAVSLVTAKPKLSGSGAVAAEITSALEVLGTAVRPLSHPRALEGAFRSYFAYKAQHPNDVRKPYLYFVDYGLSSTTPRGYVFDMNALTIVEGPFTVAHGRGSSMTQFGIPTRFSNASGSAATSLGLYLARETYAFHGRSVGGSYASVGLKLQGVSDGYNDNALARGVVAHGAPYVTATQAGRSEGCPAMEQARARLLLPKLANGAMVFLFAPDPSWMASDRWLAATGQ